MPALLFVCTANICRSPMAEAMFKQILEDRDTSGEWIVASAGTWGLDGAPAAAGSQAAMNAKGIDISNHSARSVDQEILQSFDLILTMENGHKESLQMEFLKRIKHPRFKELIKLTGLTKAIKASTKINCLTPSTFGVLKITAVRFILHWT